MGRAEELKKNQKIWQEECIQERRKALKEEEDEDRAMNDYELRLEYMLEDCTESDRCICELIDEQRGLLNKLRMRRIELFL
ncbi:hypothetical protein GN277_19035 [Lachnospiraceae bacterium WCA-9-b2]|uniref:Uncharacterized protein n=1 Tax=Sporofaciens musculi TaxID=2681861 RepID=A0A7X3SKE1_9FIRM|nr:hypothetical protein [Sporofaciens musculi]MCI9422247.1 hypothetical protein [Dorea sp.]MXP77394.1 hypothetical protein [Sporofaciens musculi]